MIKTFEKQTFFTISNIVGIKTYLYGLNDYTNENGEIDGNFDVNLTYYDNLGEERFQSFKVDFTFLIDSSYQINNVDIDSISLSLIEGQGVNCNYGIALSLDIRVDNEETIEEIEVEETKELEEINLTEEEEDTSSEIEESYKAKLDDSMNNREEQTTIISTDSRESEEEFLQSYFKEKNNYFSLLCVNVTDETMLSTISKEYNVPLEHLIKGYDRESGKVIFKVE